MGIDTLNGWNYILHTGPGFGAVPHKHSLQFSQGTFMSDIALILSVDKYEIPDSKTGEVQNLHQVWMSNEYRVATDKEKGCKPMKVLVEPEVFAQLMKYELPGLFDVDVKMRPGKGNAVAATVVGFRFISTPKIFAAPVKQAA